MINRKWKQVAVAAALLIASVMFAACSKEEATQTSAATSSETSETVVTQKTADKAPVETEKEEEEDTSEIIPEDGSTEEIFDEKYMKRYPKDINVENIDFDATGTVDDLKDDILKEKAQKFIDEGYDFCEADHMGQMLSGTGTMDAYLFRGFDVYKQEGDTQVAYEYFICSPELAEDLFYLTKVSEDDDKIVYSNGDEQYMLECKFTYDKANELLEHKWVLDLSEGVG